MNKTKDLKNLLKFLFGTIFGVCFVLVPFNFNGTVDTVLFYYIKLFVKTYSYILTPIVVLLTIASACLSLLNLINDKTFFATNPLMKKLFVTSPFYVVNRFIGAIFAVMIYTQKGPSFIISPDTGGAMLGLATQLSILVPCMLLFQTFILEYGAMEFIGEFIGKIMRPLFNVSEICATSIISAWVGPGNAAIMGTKELFEQGYFTAREAASIATQFATGSIGWVVVVSSVLGVMDYFPSIILGLLLISIIVAAICVRIPPVSKYSETYVDGSREFKHKVDREGNIFNRALNNAKSRASLVSWRNFSAKIDNMTFYIFWLTPIIICWGSLALILALYTPVLAWISLPIEFILKLFGVAEAKVAASAIMSGLADNYLPVVIASGIESTVTRIIVSMMSIISIVYLSETATLLTSTKIVPKFGDVILVFLLRTFIALPFVIIFAKFIV